MRQVIYVLLIDTDATMSSVPVPFGVAITNEDEAKKFAESSWRKDYAKLELFNTMDEVNEALKERSYAITKEHDRYMELVRLEKEQKAADEVNETPFVLDITRDIATCTECKKEYVANVIANLPTHCICGAKITDYTTGVR